MWVRDGWTDGIPSLEAELMNWADDVTYAVHDLEDFYRAGLIPIHRLQTPAEQDRFIRAAIDRKPKLGEGTDLYKALEAVFGNMALLDTPYDGGRRQRTIMNSASSSLITQFISGRAVRILSPSSEKTLEIDSEIRQQVDILQAVTKYYVIDHPRIVSVREGQREMLAKLSEIYTEAIDGKRNRALVPEGTRDRLESGDEVLRLVADLLAAMTERQVVQNYQRLMGIVPSPAAYFDV
jgi:dGTPase